MLKVNMTEITLHVSLSLFIHIWSISSNMSDSIDNYDLIKYDGNYN